MGKSVLRDRETPFQSAGWLPGRGGGWASARSPLPSGGASNIVRPYRKGIRLKFLNRDQGYFCGNATELGDAGKSPGKSSLFFLTVNPNHAKAQTTLESG